MVSRKIGQISYKLVSYKKKRVCEIRGKTFANLSVICGICAVLFLENKDAELAVKNFANMGGICGICRVLFSEIEDAKFAMKTWRILLAFVEIAYF